jgi:hypothetical protein
MKVHGATAEDRQEARRRRTAERRAAHYRGLVVGAAGRPNSQARFVCDFLMAIANDLPAAQVQGMAKEMAELADRWNGK